MLGKMQLADDFKDQIGDTPTCKKLLADGFDSLSTKRRIKRQLSAPAWYESDTGIVNFIRELSLLPVELILRPFLYGSLILLDLVYGVMSLGIAILLFQIYDKSSVMAGVRNSKIPGMQLLCILVWICANEFLHSLLALALQTPYYIGSACLGNLLHVGLLISWSRLFSLDTEWGATPILNTVASAMGIQTLRPVWPSLRFAELVFWSVLIIFWPSVSPVYEKTDTVDSVVRLLGPIFAAFVMGFLMMSLLLTLPVSREVLALFYLWYMAGLHYSIEGILSLGSGEPETKYRSYRRRARRQVNIMKQKLAGVTDPDRRELETSLSIILMAISLHYESLAATWLGRKLRMRQRLD